MLELITSKRDGLESKRYLVATSKAGSQDLSTRHMAVLREAVPDGSLQNRSFKRLRYSSTFC